ncbi:MAG: GNAT family N-acetyltransferase [Actinomycetes bacterium]
MTATPPADARRALPDDVAGVLDTLVSAFAQDPLWGALFDDPDTRPGIIAERWGPRVRNAVAAGTAWVAAGTEAVAVWLAPGTPATTPEQEVALAARLQSLLGPRAELLSQVGERFEAAWPAEPCWYLDLLGVHDRARGRGLGMALLRTSLDMVDAAGGAAYLESSNPANDARYAALGFSPRGTFAGVDGGTVTTMWRPSRAEQATGVRVSPHDRQKWA